VATPWRNEPVKLEHSTAWLSAHDKADCQPPCALHARTNHHMRAWKQVWRYDRKIIERICPHGIGHPDPDDFRVRQGLDDGNHGCDGCCEGIQ
jgi:hypothetical protein